MWTFLAGIGGGVVGLVLIVALIILVELAWGMSLNNREGDGA